MALAWATNRMATRDRTVPQKKPETMSPLSIRTEHLSDAPATAASGPVFVFQGAGVVAPDWRIEPRRPAAHRGQGEGASVPTGSSTVLCHVSGVVRIVTVAKSGESAFRLYRGPEFH